MTFRRIAQLRTAESFSDYQQELGIKIGFDETTVPAPDSALAQSFTLPDGFTIGNRFAIHPMEGWDGTRDGKPSDLTFRRWTRFGESGAKLIWGGEAVAVRPDGRANPNQLMLLEENLTDIKRLKETLVEAHDRRFNQTDDLLVGVQLTHSGRFCRPNEKARLEPLIAYHHPYLDEKFKITPEQPVLTDGEIQELIGQYVDAAEMAYSIGFQFVDIKHCHGYLLHEFLSAVDREGAYGGSFENRTRFLREVVEGIRKRVPNARIGVRLSAFDMPPHMPGPDEGKGIPVALSNGYPYAFGSNPNNPFEQQLTETIQFTELLAELDIHMLNLTAGSPYYVPHIQRPALFPPSDGYRPPEDPLVGVARQLDATTAIKQQAPEGMLIVGSGYSYLQEWLPQVAQHEVREGRVDFVGLGRMVLSYHDLPADVLAGNKLDRKRYCRTFSDCTTAPRNGMISGCFPLDDFYKTMEIHDELKEIKKSQIPG